jgi:hypothetical protein
LAILDCEIHINILGLQHIFIVLPLLCRWFKRAWEMTML